MVHQKATFRRWPINRIQSFGQPYLSSRLLKDAHLRRYPHSSSLRRTSMYASLFVISGALHLDVFEQPEQQVFFSNLLEDVAFVENDGSRRAKDLWVFLFQSFPQAFRMLRSG
jgi:hypothetical protein